MLKKYIAENLYLWANLSSAPPTQITINPTDRCNIKCQSCWKQDETPQHRIDSKNNELSDQRLFDIIEEAGRLGVRCIEITGGGEPLVRRDVTLELIRRIKARSMIGWMTSNGTLFNEEIVRLMVDSEWDKLTISLDGPDAETNDFLRPPAGNFQKITNTLSLFKEYKESSKKTLPAITFNVVVSRHNVHKLSEMVRLASRYGVQGVTFEPVQPLSASCRALSIDFEKRHAEIIEELRQAQEVASQKDIFTNLSGFLNSPQLVKHSGGMVEDMPVQSIKNGENDLLNIACIEPWFHFYIEANGYARPCCVSPAFGANVKDENLEKIWLGPEFVSFRKSILSRKYPASCNKCGANLISFSREIQGLLKQMLKASGAPNGSGQQAARRRPPVKMLITDTAPLYPPLWGGPKRIWNLFSHFPPSMFDFTYVGVDHRIRGRQKYSFKKIRNGFSEIACAFPPHYYIWHILEKTLFRNNSLDLFVYLWMHSDWHFRHVVNAQESDVVVCSHPWSSLSVDRKRCKYFIYDAHNCEYKLMSQILKGHPLKHFVLRQVKKIEGDACRKSDLILACSHEEKQEFIDLYGISDEKIMIVPNGAYMRERKSNGKPAFPGKTAIFIGAFYQPNIDAARFIVHELAPQFQDITFLIVGSVLEAFASGPLPENVRMTGYLSDEELDRALCSADMAINPMSKGSGIHIKMLDYMSYGLPVVTTKCGARGIQTEGKQPMLVCELDRFAQGIRSLITDQALADRLSRDGKELVSQQYNWETISRGLQTAILEMVG